jgi:hypothetical protein
MSVNFFAPDNAAVKVALSDESGNAVLARGTVASLPSSVAGYAVSCIYQATDSGAIYENTGTASSCTFTLMDTAATSLQLPEAATDATTTTGTSLALTQNTVTTGNGLTQSLTGLTTGIGHRVTAAAATLTTGAYFAANDGAVQVWSVKANGHMATRQSTAPTIAVTQQNGITAAAVTAGSTDTAGIITTTGTNNNGGTTILTMTFNKAYAVAPVVMITPANASGAIAGTIPFCTSTTGTAVITIPASASSGATPSFNYFVIEMGS